MSAKSSRSTTDPALPIRGSARQPKAAAAGSATAELDHVLWGAMDLGSGISRIRETLGIHATLGGAHPGIGTHNALIPLEQRTYFEILSRDPEQRRLASFGRWIENLETPRLLTWAVRCTDCDAVARAAESLGLGVEPAREMSRRRPDGSELSWRLMELAASPLAQKHLGLLPFFIEWRTGGHPCDRLGTPAARLVRLRLTTPDPSELEGLLRGLGISTAQPVEIATGNSPTIDALFQTPFGPKDLR